MEKILKGDIVQITDESHHWYPALVIVDEPRKWGFQGYALVPQRGTAYIRIESGKFSKVGEAIILAG